MKDVKLDYKKMLQNIDDLVRDDFCSTMSLLALEDKPKFTREESRRMALIIGETYSISHCIHCSACNKKYRL